MILNDSMKLFIFVNTLTFPPLLRKSQIKLKKLPLVDTLSHRIIELCIRKSKMTLQSSRTGPMYLWIVNIEIHYRNSKFKLLVT